MPRLKPALAATVAALLTLGLSARAEEPVDEPSPDAFQRTGTFSRLVADEFAAGKSSLLYELRTDDGEVLPLTFDSPPDARTGDRVAVQGWPGRRAFEVSDIRPLATPGRRALGSWTTGAKRVLVMLLNFNNETTPFTSATVTAAQNIYFGTGSSVAKYYAEASYGQVSMTGDVVLLTASIPKPTTCDTSTIATQANTLATAAGKNPSNYDFPVWVFTTIGSCGWSGLGYVGGGGNWINGSGAMGSLLVDAHELGHNFGLLHAHSYTCPSAAIAATGCTRSEYGDRFDVMGNSRAGHFNAEFKDTLAWLPGGTVKIHGGGSATYTISALEAAAQPTYAVRIPTTGTTPTREYWVEWRSRTGFDASEPTGVSNGGLVRIAPSPVGGSDLLDMNFATAGNFDDAELDVGKAFTDPQVSLTITALSKTASSLTIQVDYGAPAPGTTFHPAQPCRVFDTRNATGTYGGPALYAGQVRTWIVTGRCGIPVTAKSIAGNLTVTGPTAAGSVRLAPGGAPSTGTSTVSFRTGQTRANNVTSALDATGAVLVDGLPAGTAHLILDVVGWFE